MQNPNQMAQQQNKGRFPQDSPSASQGDEIPIANIDESQEHVSPPGSPPK
jgi:hypothetical protein